MKKIPSLFKRDYEGNRLVYNEIVPGCEWVLQGDGKATIKWDGTACLWENGVLYKRYNRKRTRHSKDFKAAPPGWIQASEPEGRHWPGWVPVNAEDPADRWHIEAILHQHENLTDGTYELVGPKIQGNPYNYPGQHWLLKHGSEKREIQPTFENIKKWLEEHPNVEGIVWHHSDGRMAKIKRRDFGLEWPPK